MKPPLEMQVPGWLFHAIRNDPAFRVLTMDGVSWIDPYTGQIVSAPFGYEDVATKHLMRVKPWVKLKPKPLDELLVLRWFHYLRENLEYVPSLRLFNTGWWLNPYLGEWVPGIPLENDKVTLRSIEEMARHLAHCKQAQTGKMIESWRIDRLVADGPMPMGRVVQGAPSSTRPVAKPAVARPLPPPPPPAATAAPLRKSQTKGGAARSSAKLARQTDFHQIKQMLIKLLARPPRIDGYQIIVHYEPHSAISRDFYDIIPIDEGRLLLAIGDITGQGPGSALMVASTLKALRLIAKDRVDLIDMVCALSEEVRPDLLQDCAITMFAALIDTRSRSMTYLSAGHHPAVLLNKDRETPMQQLGSHGEPLGKSNVDQFRRSLRPVQMRLEVGDILLMYSDGLFKAANTKKEEFGVYRLLGSCVANLGRPCNELVTQVLADAKEHAGGKFSEDMTVLALRVKPPNQQGQDPTSFNETWLGQTQLS
jgi:serine phosphatase RsbU (regulator of sigma subunit)